MKKRKFFDIFLIKFVFLSIYIFLAMAIAPRFESQLEDLRVKAGEEAQLNVRVFGTPTPVITWFREV